MTEDMTKTAPDLPTENWRPGEASRPTAPAVKTSRAQGKKGKKITNGLVALSSAAIVSIYGLGYVRTQSTEAHLTTNSAPDNPSIAIATAAPTATSSAQARQGSTIRFPFLSASTATAEPIIGRNARSIATPPTALPTTTASPTAKAAIAPQGSSVVGWRRIRPPHASRTVPSLAADRAATVASSDARHSGREDRFGGHLAVRHALFLHESRRAAEGGRRATAQRCGPHLRRDG